MLLHVVIGCGILFRFRAYQSLYSEFKSSPLFILVHKTMLCSHCNKTVPDGSLFCPMCGNRIIQTKKCPHCGIVFDNPEALFCIKCGTRLEVSDSVIQATQKYDNLSIGEIIQELQHTFTRIEQIDDFTDDGYARFKADNKFGVIDRRGTVCVPPIYRYMFEFPKEGRTKGLLPNGGDNPEIEDVDIIGSGRVLFHFKNIDLFEDPLFLIGRVFRQSEDSAGQRVFYLEDASGRRLSDKCFYYFGRFDKNGLCCVSTDPDGKTIGAINTDGRFVIPEIYTNIDTESSEWLRYNTSDGGLLRMFVGKKAGYLDSNGNIVCPFQFDDASIFQNGVAIVKQEGKSGLLDKDGKWIIYPEYEDLHYDSLKGFASYGLVGAMKNGKWGFINTNNRPITDFEYDQIGPFIEGRAMVEIIKYGRRQESLFGFINTEGKAITGIELKGYSPFSNGYAGVENDQGKWGIIDRDGKMVTDYKYDNYLVFERGFAIVKQNGLFNIIDTKLNYLSSKWWKEIKYEGCYLLKDERESCQMNSYGEFYLHKNL